MARLFLSYDHEDATRAAAIAAALEQAGHSVWWDRHIHGGAEYNSEIENAVERADAVVVLWSERSVKSAWVRDEAAEGRDRGKLVPVALDPTKPPMGFRQFQTIDLSTWSGRKAPPKMVDLLIAIQRVSGAHASAAGQSKVGQRRVRSRIPLRWLAAALAVFSALTALLLWQPWTSPGSAAVAAVVAANQSPASQDLARDLFAQLGELQTSEGRALELTAGDRRKDADMVLEVGGRREGRLTQANLVLVHGKNGGLLWSKAFERPTDKAGDLRQELGYTAAQVLGCAVEAHEGGRAAMKPDTLKLYLRGCAEFADAEFHAMAALIPLFRKIVTEAPKFEGAWSKLLIAEDQLYSEVPSPETRAQLQRDMASARRLNPHLPAAFAAEMDLLPYGSWSERLAILDRGVTANFHDPLLLGVRAHLLTAVGRIRDAINDAQKAKRISPLSPATRVQYVMALAQGGQFEAAVRELHEAERLWPGSTNVAGAKFALHLRFGNPRIALQFIRSGTLPAGWSQGVSFVEARINPTRENVDRALKDAQGVYLGSSDLLQHWVQALTIFDREDELLALLMRVPLDQAQWVTDVTFRPAGRELWRNPKALLYAKRVGLLQYWQSSGKWPDFCGETDLPYDCKKEAAKLLA